MATTKKNTTKKNTAATTKPAFKKLNASITKKVPVLVELMKTAASAREALQAEAEKLAPVFKRMTTDARRKDQFESLWERIVAELKGHYKASTLKVYKTTFKGWLGLKKETAQAEGGRKSSNAKATDVDSSETDKESTTPEVKAANEKIAAELLKVIKDHNALGELDDIWGFLCAMLDDEDSAAEDADAANDKTDNAAELEEAA